MFDRIKRGWRIVRASWAILKDNPKLLLFPVISTIALLAVISAIGLTVPDSLKSAYASALSDKALPDDPLAYVVFFAFCFACTFVVVFFNAAMIFSTLQCFEGERPSLRGGITAAFTRLPQILAWTFVATTVGLILEVLQGFLREKLGFLGDLIGNLGELAWAVLTYFVVPIVVVDGMGPIEATKRSATLMRRTWGETVGGEAGLSVFAILFSLPIIVVAAVGFAMSPDTATAVALGALVVLYVLTLSVVFTALGTIFRTGVYLYATTGVAPSGLDRSLLQGAFHAK